MIGLDTNVALRALLGDDAMQTPLARALMAGQGRAAGPIYLNLVTVAEFAWVLSRSQRLSRANVADLVEALLAAPDIVVSDRVAVEEALAMFRSSKADYADALIGVLNRRAGCATTYTFDRNAAALPVFTAVPGG